jgi:hypothetical protein
MAGNEGGFRCPRRITRDGGSDADKWTATRWNGDGAQWPEAVFRPRTCTYCGGLNPDDAIELIVDGWSLGMTDKTNEYQFNPPAGRVSPPAMVYLQHWSREQCQRADEVLRAARVFRSAVANKADYFI